MMTEYSFADWLLFVSFCSLLVRILGVHRFHHSRMCKGRRVFSNDSRPLSSWVLVL